MNPLTLKLGEDTQYLRELQALLGIKDEYGADPKAIRIALKSCINLIKKHRKNISEVIPTLTPSELDLLLPSIVNLEKRKEMILQRENEEKARSE